MVKSASKSSIKVALRVRPFNKRETNSNNVVNISNNKISINNPENIKEKKTFSYDYVYPDNTEQKQVYSDIGTKIIDNTYEGYNSCVFAYGQTGCFARGTPIMMYDGSYKPVESITHNDLLMGDDSTPRKVLKLFRGVQNMYKIKPIVKGFDEYIVNEDHIMVFAVDPSINKTWNDNKKRWRISWYDIDTKTERKKSFTPVSNDRMDRSMAEQHAIDFMNTLDGSIKIVEMRLKDYLELNKTKRAKYSCFTSAVNFQQSTIPINPYLLGLFLGDDTTTYPGQPPVDVMINIFKQLGVWKNKYIPMIYKQNSADVRLQLLAGLIDSMGFYNQTDNEYKIQQNSSMLANDILFVSRSLGYKSYIEEITTPTVYQGALINNISYINYIKATHNNHEIPTTLIKKQVSPYKPNMCLMFHPQIVPLGLGRFYGFMIDGNHRFIGAGFNVLRNSGKTHTMMGSNTPELEGIIPRICKDIFIQQTTHNNKDMGECKVTYQLEMSYLEIYSERVRDLITKASRCTSSEYRISNDYSATPPTLSNKISFRAASPVMSSPRMSPIIGKTHKVNIDPSNLKVRQHPELGPYVEGLTKVIVNNFDEIQRIINMGNKERTTAATLMNSHSSRSHAILTLYFTQIIYDPEIDRTREIVSRINLVDLAGSEKVTDSGVEGVNFDEAVEINKSLSCLSLVIKQLVKRASSKKSLSKKRSHSPSPSPSSFTPSSRVRNLNNVSNSPLPFHRKLNDKNSPSPMHRLRRVKSSNSKTSKSIHIPFRNSVLTWILSDSLGGNSKTYMIATISPSSLNYMDSINTLNYAATAGKIVNNVKINEDPKDKIIRSLQEELKKLKLLRVNNKLKKNMGYDSDDEVGAITRTNTINAVEEKQRKEKIEQLTILLKEQSKTHEQKMADSDKINEALKRQYEKELEEKKQFIEEKKELKDKLLQNETNLNNIKIDHQKMTEELQLQQQKLEKQKEEHKQKEEQLLKEKEEFEKKKLVETTTETAIQLKKYYDDEINKFKIQYTKDNNIQEHNELVDTLRTEHEEEITELKTQIDKLITEKQQQLSDKLSEHNNKVMLINTKHKQEITTILNNHKQEITTIKENISNEYEIKINQIKLENEIKAKEEKNIYNQKMMEVIEEKSDSMQRILMLNMQQEKHKAQIKELKELLQNTKSQTDNSSNTTITTLENKLKRAEAKVISYTKERAVLMKQIQQLKAKIHNIQKNNKK